jgi:UTP--glucose-1-phosphate uridylyltransferase
VDPEARFKVKKAVIPAAGLGTRFLPATKALPKEMLPLVDKPVIQYVVEEAVASDLRDLLIITGRNKNALENHFDRVAELEDVLRQAGDNKKLFSVQAPSELADIHYTRQGDPKGLGHAILRAKSHVGNDSFAVLLGDDVIDARDPLLKSMLEVHAESGDNVVALMQVPSNQIHLYGSVRISDEKGDVVIIKDLIEKANSDEAPSNLAVIGRYILRPEIFEILEETLPGKNGEIQLTDALRIAAADPKLAGAVKGVIFKGRRYDTGNKVDFIKATVKLALDREDIGPELRSWFKSLDF